MKTATFVKDVSNKGFNGKAELYKVDPPIDVLGWDDEPFLTTSFVVVSAVNAMWSGPETYIFPANEQGEVTDWGELPGSFKGALDIPQALRNADYEI